MGESALKGCEGYTGSARQCTPYEVFWAPSGAQGRPKPEGRQRITPAHQRRSEGQKTKVGTAELVPHDGERPQLEAPGPEGVEGTTPTHQQQPGTPSDR